MRKKNNENEKNDKKNNNKNIKDNNNSKKKLDLFPNINDTLKNIIFIVFVIIIISLIIFITQNDNDKEIIIPNTFTYNDVHFAKYDNYFWSFGLKHNDEFIDGFLMYNTPLHLEDIEIIGDLKSFLPSNETFISFDIKQWERDNNLKIAVTDFGIKLAGLGAYIQGQNFYKDEQMYKCSKDNHEECENIGIKTCNDNDKVIMFIEDDYTYITAEENCIKIYAKGDDFIKAADRILYTWLNIMD